PGLPGARRRGGDRPAPRPSTSRPLGLRMTGEPGTRPLIVGVALSATGAISIAALVVQLAAYDPSCEPLLDWSFSGACGPLRFLVGGLGASAAGLAPRRRHRHPPRVEPPGPGSASNEREPRQKPRR